MPSLDPLPALIDQGLAIVRERIKIAPDDAMYASIRNQLEWMKSVVASGLKPDPEKTGKLTLSLYAVREFETSDPEFCDVLANAQYLFERL